MPAMRIPTPQTGLPNWAIGLTLGACVVGTYYYTIQKVGSTDIDAEVEKELKKQARSK